MLTACKDELPNPHKKPIREILNTLVCHDNDFRRTNIELRNLKNEFKQEMDKIEYRCTLIRQPDQCPDQEKVNTFEQHIADIDEVNECFTQKIDTLQNNRKQILDTAKECLKELITEKTKFKSFHEKTVDYLKRYAIKSNDPVEISNCERDICEMHKLFVKEVSFIKRCEDELLPFFKQLDENDFQYFCNCCCFKDYEWIPKGKSFAVVEEIADNIKCVMGNTLIKAFAQIHIHQAPDPRSFLASYLLNVQHNEEVMKEKINLFGSL